MSSSNQFPFEILYQIASHLRKNDQRTCLTICKAWYRPLLEVLYEEIHFKDLRAFRSFLVNITHHRHQPNVYVKKLEMPEFVNAETLSERPISFTEFELLPRYCIYVKQIVFTDNAYWEWMSRLDLTKYWLRLTTLPHSYGSKYSLVVFDAMVDRITSLQFRAMLSMPPPPSFPQSVLEIILRAQKLRTVHIYDKALTLNISHLQQIQQQLNHIENLSLTTNVIPIEDNILYPPAKLKNFACTINDLNSSWFTIIKSYYREIDMLTVHCEDKKCSILMVKLIQSLLKTVNATNIQRVKTRFNDIYGFSSIIEATISLIINNYEYRNKSNVPPAVTLDINYYDANVFVNPRNSFESIYSRNNTNQVFKITKSWLDDDKNNNEISYLRTIYNDMNNSRLKHIKITRKTHVLGPKPPFYFDILLSQYPHLETFTFTISNEINIVERRLGRREFTAELTISDSTIRFHPLRVLKIKSPRINRSVFHYLFASCTRLEKLYLIDCGIKDDIMKVAIEYYCLQHNIELVIL